MLEKRITLDYIKNTYIYVHIFLNKILTIFFVLFFALGSCLCFFPILSRAFSKKCSLKNVEIFIDNSNFFTENSNFKLCINLCK